jgi:DNA-binding transcriptional regulator YdaS (Cro superfamily)
MALMEKSFITKAVEKAGGRGAVARALKVNVETVRQWEVRKLPAERAIDLEKISGVHRSFLRPDLWGVTA